MKLRGSQTEQLIREDLVKGNLVISTSAQDKMIVQFLRQEYSNVASVYPLHWILELEFEFFLVLVNGNILVKVELDKSENICTIIKELSIHEYKKGLKRKDHIKLLVALNLAREFEAPE